MQLVSSVIVEFGKCLWDPLKRHIEYLVFYHRNIKKLETQVQKLAKAKDDVQRDVDAALRQGETVRDNVQEWLHNVDILKSETESMVARLVDTKCWNPVLCHGLGKEAAKKMLDVDDLQSNRNFERVSHPLPPPTAESLLPTSGFEALPSTEVPMRCVLNALQDEKIQIIGVYGMGGVGKTTLMKEVFKKGAREKLFDEVVMVTISQNVIIEKIQQEIGEKLGLKLVEDIVSVRAARILERLRQVGKFLIILDDMWERLELNSMGIPYGEEHKGCKIVITTRRLQVCNTMKSQVKIQIAALSEDDSWNLFEKKAGSIANSPDLSNVARNIVKECKGLPLAIVVLGRALTDEHDAEVWNGVLNSVKQSIPTDIEGLEKEVFQSIKFSFDYLRSIEAKLCFLFCCLFPEDHNIPYKEVTWLMAGEGKIENVETLGEVENQVHVLLNNLKASGLLLEGNEKKSVKMHDIVRDVAIWIASAKTYGFYSKAGAGLKEWPRSMNTEEQQRISLMQNGICALSEEPLFSPNLRTLKLNNNYNLSRIPDRFFSEMKALEVLYLSGIKISSLPTSMSCLKSLRVLDLSNCHSLEDLSGIGTLKSLEILNLTLRFAPMLPIELRELSNLRHLSLLNARIPPNVISHLPHLEELLMYRGFDEWQVQRSEDASCASFAELACLSKLRRLFINVRDERCFSQCLGSGAFKNLVNFWIWPTFYELQPNEEGNCFAIFTSVVPNWAQQLLPKTNNLLVRRCPGMKCLFGAEGVRISSAAFSNIKTLRLAEMTDLGELCQRAPLDYGFLSKMRELKVVDCHKLTKIFSSELLMSGVEQLEYLQVVQCGQLLHVFHNDDAAGGCQIHMQLKQLGLYSLPRLISIWDEDMPLTSLRRLEVTRCEKLTSLFSWKQAQRLECLQELYVSGCPDMVAIIMSEKENSEEGAIGDNTSALPELQKLELRGLKITGFDTGGALFDWRSLKTLTIVKCPNLKKLPLSRNGGLNLCSIRGSKKWFRALEWDDKSIRSRLQTVFTIINDDNDDDNDDDEDEELIRTTTRRRSALEKELVDLEMDYEIRPRLQTVFIDVDDDDDDDDDDNEDEELIRTRRRSALEKEFLDLEMGVASMVQSSF